MIFQSMKRLIVECFILATKVESYFDKLDLSQLMLRFLFLDRKNDRQYIDVGLPSIMIDGWLPFGGSQNTLKLFLQHGKLRKLSSNALYKYLKLK